LERPDIPLEQLSIGKMFQISPEGKDSVQLVYGGDFIIATEYEESGVVGYMANVYDQSNSARTNGVINILIPWKYLHCVGSVHWFREQKKENNHGKSDSKQD